MKKTILIVDDVENNRELLAALFEDRYNAIQAADGEEAINMIRERDGDLCAILLDLLMPKKNGLEVLKAINKMGYTNIPVFLITAEEDREMLMEGYNLGAVDVIRKPFFSNFLRCRVNNIVELYSHRNELESIVEEQVEHIRQMNQSLVETLAELIEFRDCESGEHVKRICGLTDLFMTQISNMYPEYHLPKAEIDKIVTAAMLHDVGKIAISDTILNKPGRLTKEEFEIMKTHTTKGCEILQKIPSVMEEGIYKYSYDICRHHHERWDGRGYPDGLAGDDISIWAQVVALADVYDALTSPRVYKAAFSHETAVNMIYNNECGVFNPKLLKAFEQVMDVVVSKSWLKKKDSAR